MSSGWRRKRFERKSEVPKSDSRSRATRRCSASMRKYGLGVRERRREVGEVRDRLVRVGRAERVRQERDGRGGIAERREGGLPARHRVDGGEHAVRVDEPSPRGDLDAPLTLHLRVGEQGEVRVERHRAGAGPEEPGEEPRDALAVGGEGRLERVLARVAHRARQPASLARRWEPMGLRTVDHLDAVLGAAQEQVRVGELVAVLRRDDPGEEEPVERRQHRALAQRARLLAPAVEELERGDEELGLADAALPELEVVLALRAGARVDARLHRLDLLHHREVETPAPDEGLELQQQLVADREVACAGARLHEGVPLPAASERLVVELGRPEAVHDRARSGRRA